MGPNLKKTLRPVGGRIIWKGKRVDASQIERGMFLCVNERTD